MFSIATNLNSKLTSTPGRMVITTRGGTLPSIVNILGTASTSGNSTPLSINLVGSSGGMSGPGGTWTSIPGGGATVGASSSGSRRLGGRMGEMVLE